MTSSPRIPGLTAGAVPAPHTPEELATLLRLASAAQTVAIGHARDDASRAAATAFGEAWEAAGRTVVAIADWPEEAASWLRPARRLTEARPDAWIIAGSPHGWAQLSRRLRHSTDWNPLRSFGFASVGDPAVVRLSGAAVLGMRGAGADGSVWQTGCGRITHRLSPARLTR
ncbi:hypothetical protein [Phytomonospora endophytica]|uniref:Leucine-binding protein domain-containing protein n=1 Tax=Phytomonospora endophytica TaxID=714109 RepID=A0A841FPW3_9ACTN|nr:hypothetical protein [Phytomonospora endophytica]MBB6038136.1 hypothetical protein [Phytomonospora endophytica]GIG67401.1 hypothetical protein Pen01_36960 [Phytomonospora endophytica]